MTDTDTPWKAEAPFIPAAERYPIAMTVRGVEVGAFVVTKYLPGLAIIPVVERASRPDNGWFDLIHTGGSGMKVVSGVCQRHMETVVLPAVQVLRVDWSRPAADLATDVAVRCGVERIWEARSSGDLPACTNACVPGQPYPGE